MQTIFFHFSGGMAHKLAHNISVHRTRWVYELSMVRMSRYCSSLITVYIQLVYSFLDFIHLSFSFFLFPVLIQPEIILYSIFFVLRKSTDDGISSWDWKLKGDRSTYHALFPRAWTVYDGNDANYL
jgi:hypothetical protein